MVSHWLFGHSYFLFIFYLSLSLKATDRIIAHAHVVEVTWAIIVSFANLQVLVYHLLLAKISCSNIVLELGALGLSSRPARTGAAALAAMHGGDRGVGDSGRGRGEERKEARKP